MLAVAGTARRALAPAVLSGAEIKASLARDAAALRTEAAREDARPRLFWTPLALGDTATLTITVPHDHAPGAVALDLPRLSHLFALPFTPPGESYSGPSDCHRDVVCSDDPLLQRLARATAVVLYVLPGGGSNACTGTLLADSDPETRIPYLLTAHHCVPDQWQGSTVETFWRHEAAACGGRPNTAPVRVTGGAEPLYARKTIDTAFLRLRRPAPAGARFAEWSPTLPEHGAEVVSVHHPQGQPVKMARGTVVAHWHCAEVAYCGEDAEADGVHYFGVAWREGLTSGGSSGAGAFLADSGALVGVNTGGLSTCQTRAGPDDFGRSNLGYREALRRWLGR